MSTPATERAAVWASALAALDLDGIDPLLVPEPPDAAPRSPGPVPVEGVRDGLPATEAVERSLAAIRESDSRLRMFVTVLEARARRDAAAVDARRSGERGSLAGLTVAVKDCITIAGAPTTCGSLATTGTIATADAAVVARMVEAGAVVVGSTNMNEFGVGGFPLLGEVLNPRDPSRPAGGSSGGSAAAVAAGCVDLALGTDAGGSVRLPAAYCGVVGLKPTFARLPGDGVTSGAPSLGHVGLIALGVDDARRSFGALVNTEAAPPMPRAPRLGLLAGSDSVPVEPQVQEAMAMAVERLRHRGVTVEVVQIAELRDWLAPFLVTITSEIAASVTRLVGAHADIVSEEIRDTLALGAAIPATAYVQAQRYRRQLADAITKALACFDALLVQTLDRVAPTSETLPDDPLYWGECRWIAPFNLTGHPAISLPLPAAGAPPALQLIGRYGGDEELLALAARVESVVGH
jgi:aspartyl-tRNA(Asn)/glutamyl-tRNA(Gln) amidotransferase subunit A